MQSLFAPLGWVTTTDQYGYVIRYKARLVALGDWQHLGIDFTKTFSPVARMASFRLVVGLAAMLDLKLYVGDVNTAYLNAKLKIPQYVRDIDGFLARTPGTYMSYEEPSMNFGKQEGNRIKSWIVG